MEVIKLYRKIVATRLKNARKALDLTQKEVFLRTGIGQDKISKIENGIYEPDVDTIGILIKEYNISADWLFGFDIIVSTKTLEHQPIFRT